MGKEHLPADLNLAEEGKQMMDKNLKVKFPETQGLKKLMSIKVPLLYVLIIVAVLISVIIICVAVPAAKSPAPQQSTADLCTGDWIQVRGKCYYFSNVMDTWNNSRDFCIENKSTLVTIDNEQELNFLNRYKTQENYWIGLSRKEDVSGWVWVNGTSFQNIFGITTDSLSGRFEHAFLNHDGVKSDLSHFPKKYICMKR